MRKIIYISLILFLYACGPTVIHSDKLELGEQWSYSDVLISKIEAPDTTKRYDLALKVTHNLEYDYQNLYLQVETTFPNGKKISNPLSLDLSDKKGIWLGKCGSKDCDITFSFQDNFRFKSLGSHEFSIGQYSREDQLSGVSEIELILFEGREE